MARGIRAFVAVTGSGSERETFMGETTLRWSAGLDAEVARAARALLERATAEDGVAPVSEQAVLSLAATDSAAEHLLALHDGVLAGHANLVPAHGEHPAMAEVAVDPAARGHGIGAELVSAALARGGSGARVWAHGNRPAAA